MTSLAATSSTPRASLPGWSALLLLLALVGVVFGASAWRADYLNFDDNLFFGPDEVEFRAAYEEGDFGAILDPQRTIANAYLPVSHASLFVDYALGRALTGGPAPRLAHLHSLLLHGLAAFALARLLGRLGLGVWPAVAGAAAFALHPALCESVLWASSRKDLLSGLLVFCCLSAVVEHTHRPRRWAAVAAVLCGGLAVYAKGTAVVLVLLAPLLAWVAGRRRGKWSFGRVGPGLAVAAVAVLAAVHHAGIAASEGALRAVPMTERLAQVPGAWLHYATTAAWPVGLNVLYPEVQTLAAFGARAGWGVAALIGVLAAAIWVWRVGRPLAATGLVAALLAWLPFNTAWPASSIAAADRYLYLVLPWLALAVVAWHRRWGPVLAAVLVVPLGAVAWQRGQAFESSEALWESSLVAAPENAVARINLAIEILPREPRRARALVEQAVEDARYPEHRLRATAFLRDLAWQAGRLEEAGRHARHAVVAARELADRPAARAVILQAELSGASMLRANGADDEARQLLQAAAGRAPDDPAVLAFEAEWLRSEAVGADGVVDPQATASQRARDLLDRALAAAPDHFDALLSRARWQRARGELMSAFAHFRRAAQREPVRPEAHIGLADLFLATGDFQAAEEAARRGLAERLDEPNLLVRLGLALTGQGRLDDAEQYYERYLRVRPTDAAVRRALASVLSTKLMPRLFQQTAEELDRAAARIAALDPEHAKLWLIRGVAARQRREFTAAIVLLEKAAELMPEREDPVRLLAETHRDRGYALLQGGDTEAALDAFRRFVDVGTPDVDQEAVLGILRTHWGRHERAGVAAFQRGALAAAEAAFRRCLQLVPAQRSACLQLGLAILEQDDARAAEALQWFEEAEAGQVAAGLEASLPVLYQVQTLQRLGRAEEAVARGRRYLEAVRVARPSVLQRIRDAVGDS
ncbi:MAG: tetratricopeptide repeat protein [Planctomycetota bacterium]